MLESRSNFCVSFVQGFLHICTRRTSFDDKRFHSMLNAVGIKRNLFAISECIHDFSFFSFQLLLKFFNLFLVLLIKNPNMEMDLEERVRLDLPS